MISQEKLLGTVSFTPNHRACYVRVSVPDWRENIPLAIKATFSDFNWRDLEKGDIVEIERTDPNDARCFKVTRLMKGVEPKKPSTTSVRWSQEGPVESKRRKTMTNQVRFFIGAKYLQDRAIYPVLVQALGLEESKVRTLFTKHSNGFWVICREDQFARFMIYRNEAGIQNGFLDLKATMYTDVYERVATAAGVGLTAVKNVLRTLNFNRATVEEHLEPRTEGVDVSQN